MHESIKVDNIWNVAYFEVYLSSRCSLFAFLEVENMYQLERNPIVLVNTDSIHVIPTEQQLLLEQYMIHDSMY